MPEADDIIDPERVEELRQIPSLFVEEIIGREPLPYQEEVLDSDAERKAFVSGRQVGKSLTSAWIAIHRAITTPNSTVLITAPSQRQSSELFKTVKKEMDHSGFGEEEWGVERPTRTVIEFVNGSRIICLPVGNDGSTIRGYTADLVIVDEAAFIDDKVFTSVLKHMLATTGGDLVLLSTPWGKSGYLYEAFRDGQENDDSPWFSKRVPTYRNPMVPDEFIEEQQDELTTQEFKQEILGKFDEDAAAAFTSEEIEAAIDRPSARTTKDCYLAVDVATQGEDVAVFMSVDGEGHVFALEDQHKSTLTESVARIQYLHSMYDYSGILIDQTAVGEGVVEMLDQEMRPGLVEGVKFSSKTKNEMYTELKNRMEQNTISIPDHPELKKQLSDVEYEYSKKLQTRTLSMPNERHDDYLDALMLASWVLRERRRPIQKAPATASARGSSRGGTNERKQRSRSHPRDTYRHQ